MSDELPRDGRHGRRIVVRAPNHLGELILALPALRRVAERERTAGREPPLVQVTAWLVPLLELADAGGEVVPLASRRGLVRGARALRRAAGGAPVDAITLTPSFSSALLLRLAGVRTLRGTRGGGRTWLLTDPVDRKPLLEGHRVDEFLALCGFGPAGTPPRLGPAAAGAAREAWQRGEATASARAALALGDGPAVGLFPGANGSSRRWPAARFGDLAARLGREGATVLVFGGASDAGLTAMVAGRGGDRTLDLGGRTSLAELAGGLLSCDLLVTNDTGPMHLAAAAGAPVLALEGPADLRQTRPLGSRVRMIGRFDLPCVPCVKNECPRTGAGYVLAEAKRECMRLITVDEVEAAVHEMLGMDRSEEST